MSGRLTSTLLALFAVAVVAVVALSVHDAFYGAMGVSPFDVGLGLTEVLARTALYSLVVLAPALVAAALTLWGLAWVGDKLLGESAAQKIGDHLKVRDLVVAALITVVVLVDIPELLVLDPPSLVGIVAPDFWDFVEEKWYRVVAVAGAIFVPLAALAWWGRLHGGLTPSVSPIELALIGVVVVVPATCAIVLAGQWGEHLGNRAADGAVVRSAQFDPFHLRSEPVCITPSDERRQNRQLSGAFVYLGQNGGDIVVFDRDQPGAVRLSSTNASIHEVSTGSVADVVCAARQRDPADPGGDPAADHALAERFRPMLRFDSREPWRPVEVEGFFAESFPAGGTHRLCIVECSPIASSLQLTRTEGEYLDIHGRDPNGRDYATPEERCKKGLLLDCDAGARSAIYYRVTRAFDRVFVDYWWFFRYNHFPVRGRGLCGGAGHAAGNHEGDWEGVTAVTEAGRPERLAWLGFSAHGHLFRYLDREPETEDGRPVVYVACGSHAAYPRPCEGRCRQTRHRCRSEPCKPSVSTLAEAPFDGEQPWGRNATSECQREPLCLRPLPRSAALPAPVRESGGTAFTDWAGRWGTAGRGPRSPARQPRFVRPWEQVASIRTKFGSTRSRGKPPVNPADAR